jgi:hypothetical protein
MLVLITTNKGFVKADTNDRFDSDGSRSKSNNEKDGLPTIPEMICSVVLIDFLLSLIIYSEAHTRILFGQQNQFWSALATQKALFLECLLFLLIPSSLPCICISWFRLKSKWLTVFTLIICGLLLAGLLWNIKRWMLTDFTSSQ